MRNTWSIFFLSFCLHIQASWADNVLDLAIIVNQQSPLSLRVTNSLKQQLDNSLTKPHIFDAGNPYLKENLVKIQPTLILTVGSRSLNSLLDIELAIPILSIFIPKTSFHSIIDKAKSTPNISVIYLDQPYDRQMHLCRLLFPKKKRVGMLFGPQSADRQPELLATSKKHGLQLVSHTMASDKELKVALNKVIKSSDYLLLVADDRVVTHPNNAKFILQYAYVARIPVVGFSNAFVRAGGTAAIFSTPKHIGDQAAETVNSIFQDYINRKLRRLILPSPQHPKYFTIRINAHAAYLLGVSGEEKELIRKLKSNEPKKP